MCRAWLDFLQAEAAAHPVLLVLNDLQWGDFGTTLPRRRATRVLRADVDDARAARPEWFEVFPRLWSDRQNVQMTFCSW